MFESLTLMLVPLFIFSFICLFIPLMVWFFSLIYLDRIGLKNSLLKILLLSITGLLVLFPLCFFFTEIIAFPLIIEFLVFIILVWLIFTYFHVNLLIVHYILQKNKPQFVPFVMFPAVALGLIMAVFGISLNFWDLFFLGTVITISVSWLIISLIIERLVTGSWPVFKANSMASVVVSLDFKQTTISKALNDLSSVFWRPSLLKLYWIAMIISTVIEFSLFLLYGYEFITNILANFDMVLFIVVFMLTSIVMDTIHEWGHLMGARFYGGFGSYKIKIYPFISKEAVEIPLLIYTPRERIKIASLGVLWTNLFSVLPTLVLIVSAFYFQEFLENPLILIPLCMIFYAVLSTFFFFMSLWPGGDMNNCIRDFYMILTGTKEVPTTIFSSESSTSYSLKEPNFVFNEEIYYSFPRRVSFKQISDKQMYLLDEEEFDAYLINVSTRSILEIILSKEYWKLADIERNIREKYEIPDSQTASVIEDIVKILTFLGLRGYLVAK